MRNRTNCAWHVMFSREIAHGKERSPCSVAHIILAMSIATACHLLQWNITLCNCQYMATPIPTHIWHKNGKLSRLNYQSLELVQGIVLLPSHQWQQTASWHSSTHSLHHYITCTSLTPPARSIYQSNKMSYFASNHICVCVCKVKFPSWKMVALGLN